MLCEFIALMLFPVTSDEMHNDQAGGAGLRVGSRLLLLLFCIHRMNPVNSTWQWPCHVDSTINISRLIISIIFRHFQQLLRGDRLTLLNCSRRQHACLRQNTD